MEEQLTSDKKQGWDPQNDILLLAIPQAQLQIYSKCIILLFTQTPRKNTMTLSTLPSLIQENQCADKNKMLMLNDRDLVFQIFEETKSVHIVSIKNHSTILQFQVNYLSTLLTVQSILRTKMCELGFHRIYSIIKKIGQGASAEVHLIQRVSDGRLFAVKVITLNNSPEKGYSTFINEVRLLRVLRQHYIVRLESVYYSKKNLYQVLQYLNEKVIKTDADKWRVVNHLTQAIEHMRQKKILHRDLKLENVLIRINQDGTKDYVISDFGLGSWINDKSPVFQRCGTPGYIAPEILRAGKGSCILKHQCDIFSLGVLAHFVFLSRSLFKYDGDTRELLIRNKKADINLQSNTYAELSPSALSFLELTLKVDPKKRVSSEELIQRFFAKTHTTNRHNQQIPVVPQSLATKDSVRDMNKSEPKISIRNDTSSHRKIQCKQTKQNFSAQSLMKSLQKLSIVNRSKRNDQIKTEREKSYFDTIMDKFSFKTERSSSIKKKKQKSIKKVQMRQYFE